MKEKRLLIPLILSLACNVWLLMKDPHGMPPGRTKGIQAAAAAPGKSDVSERRSAGQRETSGSHPSAEEIEEILHRVHDREPWNDRFAEWVRIAPKEALRWAEDHAEGNIRMDLLQRGMSEWAKLDPPAAADWVLGMANDYTYESSVLDLAGTWGAADGQAASAWISAIPELGLRKSAAEALADTWGQSNPAAAAPWCLAFERDHPDSPTFGRCLAAWAEADPAGALKYYDSLELDDTVANGASLLASAAAESDPHATIAWAESIRDQATRWEALNCAIDSWAQVSPREAASQILLMENREEKIHHIETLVRHWSASDNGAVESWITGLPIGEFRETAIASLAANLMESAPSRSMDWALKLGSGASKERISRETYSLWLEEDPDRATSWLESNKGAMQGSLLESLEEIRRSPEAR